MNLNAAVIVLHEQASDSLVLTRRSSHLRDHPGEICFPGGRWQEGDKTFYETATRELQEELGIPPARIHPIRMLDSQPTLTGFLIHPWLASIDTLLPFHINNDEVAEVLQVAMCKVCQRSNYRQIAVKRQGMKMTTWQFKHDADLIWGATAKIMMQLINT